jgi:acyl dehydratase
MDVAVGDSLPPWEMKRVSPERMKLLAAILRDPNPIHWDPAEVARRGLGERTINQGPTNLGYVINMLMAWAGPASLRHIAARFTANVFSEDCVVAGGTVTALRESSGERLADCEVWLDRSDGTRAVAAVATVALPAGLSGWG